jgi:hypothetical protein
MSDQMQQCPSCGELVPTEYITCVWCGFDLTAEHIKKAGIVFDNRDIALRAYKVIRNPIQAFREIAILPDSKGGLYTIYLIGLMITLHIIIIMAKISAVGFDAETNYIQDPERLVDYLLNVFIWFLQFVPGLTILVFIPFVFMLLFLIALNIGSRFIRILSKLVGGGSDKEKIKATVGYTLIPVLIGWTITLPFRLMSPSQTGSINEAVEVIRTSGIGEFINVILLICWLWTLVLAIIGIGKAARLNVIESIVVAGLPYGLLITVMLI